MSDKVLPTDTFSLERRRVQADPASLGSGSTIHATDFYGNLETWVVESYRMGDGDELIFLQRNGAEGGIRLVLPSKVVAAIAQHRDAIARRAKRRQGHALVARRKERGDTLGNAAALEKARKARKGARS